jgi:hypothetical protein
MFRGSTLIPYSLLSDNILTLQQLRHFILAVTVPPSSFPIEDIPGRSSKLVFRSAILRISLSL